jgi:hypothetical protein
MKLATRTYRPDTVSVSSWIAPDDQDSLRQWWKWAGPKTEYMARNDAEILAIRRKLRDGAYTVTAQKRQGRFFLTAEG